MKYGRNRVKNIKGNFYSPLQIRNEKIYASSIENYAFRRSKIMNDLNDNNVIYLIKPKETVDRKINELLNNIVDYKYEEKKQLRSDDGLRNSILKALRTLEGRAPKNTYDFSELVA